MLQSMGLQSQTRLSDLTEGNRRKGNPCEDRSHSTGAQGSAHLLREPETGDGTWLSPGPRGSPLRAHAALPTSTSLVLKAPVSFLKLCLFHRA